jgi:hypothetical protein
MSDRGKILQNFKVAARALIAEGLSGLNPTKAILVDAAMKAGADPVLIYSSTTEKIIGAIAPLDPEGDPLEVFRIESDLESGEFH